MCEHRAMADVVVIGSDGSVAALDAARRGLALVRPDVTPVIVAVADPLDTGLLAGASGLAGGVVSGEQLDEIEQERIRAAERVVAATQAALPVPAEGRILDGPAGAAICAVAVELSAVAIIVGSRGNGGIKRALLGSVSDHVVRHAPCPVVVVGDHHS